MSLTMANTIRFGISSSIFNNFTGSIQKAYDYVKKLDKSLNDIRIVSNASAADMERFAKYANTAAQNLGATTLDYTKAALIYFQQGLDEEQVKLRSDITVKMSNVLGESAEQVSDYMTAIWNNFAEGSENLEYYADVLAKLGAETASSAEEISQGLEKFSSVADTVGLSYEYAAAALTTVTDRTRQSADVVGTAFKTLFARIQDLELGDEGSVTIGKYSEALEKFDIHVLDSQGNLKKMDDILNEMGTKWHTMSEAQKVALAQNVAGVRQYTQLMSLMEN
jgi:TP901 family phage tail tape measure protein